jgi:threonine-phosphate decarboxylase
MIKGHGNDIYKYKKKIIADFSSNVVSGGISYGLEKHLIQNINTISNYPEPDAGSLQKIIAQYHKTELNKVLVTNGSTEAFYLIAQVFHAKKSVISIPSFAEYEDACKSHSHKIEFLSNQMIKPDTKFNADTVWIGNPNNPDGKIIPLDTIEKLCKTKPEIYFIIDEAYAELNINHQSCISIINKFHNIIVVRSLTKCFAVPGIRLGYLITNEYLQEKLMNIKVPWSVNSLSIETGKYIMQNYNKLLPNVNELILQSKNFQKELNKLNDLEIFETDCNYFLIKLSKGNSTDLKNFLINKYGILIRDASNFRGLNNSYFRIAVQSNSLNKKLIEGIKKCLQQTNFNLLLGRYEKTIS